MSHILSEINVDENITLSKILQMEIQFLADAERVPIWFNQSSFRKPRALSSGNFTYFKNSEIMANVLKSYEKHAIAFGNVRLRKCLKNDVKFSANHEDFGTFSELFRKSLGNSGNCSKTL